MHTRHGKSATDESTHMTTVGPNTKHTSIGTSIVLSSSLLNSPKNKMRCLLAKGWITTL